MHRARLRTLRQHRGGHVLGLADEYAVDAKYQTMFGDGTSYKCQNYKRSLGDGDVSALLVHY